MPKKKIPEFPDLIQEQGGFGRIQFVFFFLICAGINAVGWEQYNYYLTSEPTWDCQYKRNIEGVEKNFHYVFDSNKPLPLEDTYAIKVCNTDYYCRNDARWKEHPDMVLNFAKNYLDYTTNPPTYIPNEKEDPDNGEKVLFAYDNLYTRYNLTCANKAGIIALPQTMYFIGAVTGALTIPALSDIYGRRKTFLWCCGGSIVMFIIQAIVGQWVGGDKMWAYYIINATMFVNGGLSTSRKSIGFCFITELAPKLY